MVEKASTHRDVVETVLSLDEPYRSTVLMRYFEQLSHAEIARRQGTTRATVASRLTRGLDRLRQRLEAKHGGDRGALYSALIALAGPSPGLAVPTLGAKLMHVALGASFLAAAATAVTTIDWEPRAVEPAASPAVAAQEPVSLAAPQGLASPRLDLQPVEPVALEPALEGPIPLAFVDREDDWVAEFYETLGLAGDVETITVSANAGAVNVQPSTSGSIEIDAVVRANQERVEPSKMTYVFQDHVEIKREKGVLKIEDAHEENGWSVSLTVRIPRSLDLLANSGAGPVTVSYAGRSVTANSGAGPVTIALPQDEVDSVNANSGAGRVVVDVFGTRESLDANSGAGSVQVQVRAWNAIGHTSANTGAGSVELIVPSNVIGTFEARSDMGAVEFPGSLGLRKTKRDMGAHAEGTVGNGGGSYSLHSGVGSVKIRFAGTSAARPL